jgi:hypothetical protein
MTSPAQARKLQCCSCGLWFDVGDVSDADFEEMQRVHFFKCNDCVSRAVIDYEEDE